MNKKNKALVVVLLLLVVSVIALFMLVVKPLIAEEAEPEAVPETQEGESLGVLGKYQIHDKLDRNRIAKIHIHNSISDYSFVRDKSGDFVIEGMEDLPYNEKYFSALVSIVGNPLALVKVDSDDSGYEEYGIKDSDVYWEVTSTDGKVYRMTVGHMTHTGGGYYVAYSGRAAVYVLGGDISMALGIEEKGTTLDLTVLKPIEFYVTPVLIAGIDTNDFYTMDQFTVFHGDEMFLSTKIVDKKDQVNPDAIVENILTYPAPYQTNDNIYYQILQQVASLGGTSVAKAGATEEDFKKYGLDDPEYMIAFYYKDLLYTIIVSEKNEDGTYYATSTFNPTVVVTVPEDTLYFLEEELLYWISPNPFSYNITGIDKISVSGKNAAYDFYLRHGIDENKKATLVVDAQNLLTGESKTIADADKVWDFRSSYRTVLYTQIEDEVTLTEEQVKELTADESKLVLTFEYTLSSGTKRTLKFWQYSTRRTLLTIDGEGQYYVYLDRTSKIISDFTKVWNGETVDSHAKD
ncbi:MAG: DUF4340 domain-containing protein [Ruminococcaceae bacterium]|nr:DUF4340 domain-containing protein [Oscillospiraceae bacterium]